MVVKNNQTVVIGGLIQEKEFDKTTKVPLLGDIPILGWFFKYKSRQKQKTNLLVFITPHVIEDFTELDEIRIKKEMEYLEGPEKTKIKDNGS